MSSPLSRTAFYAHIHHLHYHTDTDTLTCAHTFYPPGKTLVIFQLFLAHGRVSKSFLLINVSEDVGVSSHCEWAPPQQEPRPFSQDAAAGWFKA